MVTTKTTATGLILLLLAARTSFGDDAKLLGVSLDERLLRDAGLDDPQKCLAFLRKRSTPEDDLPHLDGLIRDLGSRRFAERAAAAKRLVKLGPAALARLRDARAGADKDVARLARSCIEEIDKGWNPNLELAVVRRVVASSPEGAVPALLRLLPFAASEDLEEEVWFGLYQLAAQGKPEPAFEAALKDPIPARRAVAGLVLGRRGNAGQRDAAKALLKDADPLVRLRAAQGLLAAGDLAGLPALVALLERTPALLAWQAEELLHYVAGEDAPSVTIGAGAEATRKKCREAWETWWRQQGTKLDATKLSLEARRPGLLLLRNTNGHAWVCGCDGKTRWQLTDLHGMTDLHLLSKGHVLVAQDLAVRRPRKKANEDEGFGVTERALDGQIVWHCRAARSAQACLRQPNGNTRIFRWDRGMEVIEVNAEAEQVSSRAAERLENGLRPVYPYLLGNGNLFYCQDEGGWDYPGQFAQVDQTTGKALTMTRPRQDARPAGSIRLLPNGNYLCWTPSTRSVREVDVQGRQVWSHRLNSPNIHGAARLRDGGTLVVISAPYRDRVIEIDPAGKTVWEAPAEGGPSLCVCLSLVRLGFDHPRPKGYDLETSVTLRIQGLSSKDPAIRRLSAWALAERSDDVRAAIPALIDTLADPEGPVRAGAMDALLKIGRPAVEPVRAALKDKRPLARASAVRLIGGYVRKEYFGSDQEKIFAEVRGMLGDEDPHPRRAAVFALQVFPTHKKEIVPALVKALKDSGMAHYPSEGSVAEGAAAVLGQFGPAAKDAVPALIEAVNSGGPYLRSAAIESLWRVGPSGKVAIPHLVKALQPNDLKDARDPRAGYRVRSYAAAVLGKMAPEARVAIPALEQALLDPDEGFRNAVKEALAKLKH